VSRRVVVALVVGLALIAVALALVLSASPMRVLGENSYTAGDTALIIPGGTGVCQAGEVVPKGTTALRLELEAPIGPRVEVTVRSGGRILASGTHGSGWIGGEVTVPIGRIRRTIGPVQVCFSIAPTREQVLMVGRSVPHSELAVPPERMGVEYLAPSRRSWWSSALSVARRMGLGRAPGGSWVGLLVAALMLAVGTCACWVCLRELGASASHPPGVARRPGSRLARLALIPRRLPRAAWACALVACLNAAAWSILSPPFQVPDEPAHFAYVQQLAESHRLPLNSGPYYSVEEEAVLHDLRHFDVQFRPAEHTITSRAQQRKLEHDLARRLARTGAGDAGVAASEPPLYYALETIPYELASGANLLDRLELMRLQSGLFAAITALFAFMFVREALPRVRWAWTVGGLGVALAPLLGFMSGAVNPDALLFAVSAALFYLLARAFRHGLSRRLACAIGAALVLGVLTQLDFLGLLPGAVAGLAAAALRTPSRSRRSRLGALALGLGVLATPALMYLLLSSVANGRAPSMVSDLASNVAGHGSPLAAVTYMWQLYLPRLPGMSNYFPGIFTTRQLWFDGLVGLYGWAETVFPGWAEDLALLPAGLVALLCLRTLLARRAALARRVVELLVYAAMGLGVLVVVGFASYDTNVITSTGPYWEPRYLLPLLPLFGAVLALAARGAGRRWGPVAGTLIVMLILAHDVFSQLLVVSRYYG
jgi:hypothetical protein